MKISAANGLVRTFANRDLPTVVTRFSSVEVLTSRLSRYFEIFSSCNGLTFAVLYAEKIGDNTDAIVIWKFASDASENKKDFLDKCKVTEESWHQDEATNDIVDVIVGIIEEGERRE